MPEFKPGDKATTDKAEVEVTNTAAPLKPGKHRFQLVVTGNDGVSSEPVFADITVVDRFTITPPQNIVFGQPFTLTAKSTSSIALDGLKFTWTLTN